VTKWRSEADKWLGKLDEKDQMPPPQGENQSGAFVGLSRDQWNEHFLYWNTVFSDSLLYDTPQDVAGAAAQKASDMMGMKFQSVTTADGGTVYVPKQIYGILPQTFIELERQIRLATDIDDRGFLGFGSSNDVEYQMDRGVRLFDGRVFVPGFIGEDDIPSVWYEFDRDFRIAEPPRTGLPSGQQNLLTIFADDRRTRLKREGVDKRIHRAGEGDEGQSILDAAEAGTLAANERSSEITRAENLIGRAATIAQVERMFFAQNQRRDQGKGYVWFFNEFVGGADVEPKAYDKAMSGPGRVFNTHMQGIDWLTKNRTGGVWSGQSPQWQADQLNSALQHLQYGEKFMIKPEEMPDINAFVESLRLP